MIVIKWWFNKQLHPGIWYLGKKQFSLKTDLHVQKWKKSMFPLSSRIPHQKTTSSWTLRSLRSWEICFELALNLQIQNGFYISYRLQRCFILFHFDLFHNNLTNLCKTEEKHSVLSPDHHDLYTSAHLLLVRVMMLWRWISHRATSTHNNRLLPFPCPLVKVMMECSLEYQLEPYWYHGKPYQQITCQSK